MKKLTLLLIMGLCLAGSGFAQETKAKQGQTKPEKAANEKTPKNPGKRPTALIRAGRNQEKAKQEAAKEAQKKAASAKRRAEGRKRNEAAKIKKEAASAKRKADRARKAKEKAAKRPIKTKKIRTPKRSLKTRKDSQALKNTGSRQLAPDRGGITGRNKTIDSGTAATSRKNQDQRNIVTYVRPTRDDGSGELVTLGIGWSNRPNGQIAREGYYKKKEILMSTLIPGIAEAISAAWTGPRKGTAEYTLKQDAKQQRELVSKFADDILFKIGELRVELE
jgi:hypothetical protein